ncbi:heterokaryon incompatibility protein-domain-containing protein, partial [Cadophora sp. MPI-SDFR-AT-0126]
MDPQHQDTFKHTPLAPGNNIRLLALEPSRDFNSDIRCRLTEPSLNEARGRYEALSYVWGSQTFDHKIICNDSPFYVTTNCMLALRYLRKKVRVRRLWIDAICIDQSSKAERGHQVELMGEIYKFANNVIVWLGEQQLGTRRAFRHAHNFYRLTRVIKKSKILTDGRKLPPEFLPLLNHAWFRRVWTFQELLMASRVTVYCGRCSLPWEAFARRVNLSRFSDVSGDVNSLCMDIRLINITRSLWNVEVRVTDHNSAKIPLDGRSKTCYDASKPTLAGNHGWLFILAMLWESTRKRSCSEPLDRLFGLYGLLRNIGFSLPQPDYHKTGLQVSQEVTLSCLMFGRSLLPLYGFVHRRFSSGGPSWAIDWERFGDRVSHIRTWGIKEGSHSAFRHDYRPNIDDNRLGLKGIIHGSLYGFGTPIPYKEEDAYSERGISLRLVMFNWLQEMLNLTKTFQKCPNGQVAWEAFFIAYFKGYYTFGSTQSVLTSMTKFLLQCGMVASQLPRHIDLLKLGAGGSVPKQLPTLEKDELYTYVRDDAIMRDFTEKITYTARYCSGGTSFRTSKGWIGVSMYPIQPSDQIALLHGSSVPAILRPVGEHYQLVSFASVQGIPDSAWPVNGDEEGMQSVVL